MSKKTNKASRAHRRLVNLPPEDILEQNILADELIEWVQGAVYAIEEFPISKSMAPSRFYAITNTNEYFADALDLARYIIGCRLQKGLRDKTLDKDYVLRLLPIYNQAYKDLMLTKLKESDAARSGKINIIMPSFSSADEVSAKNN
jgi:hypothetical protein